MDTDSSSKFINFPARLRSIPQYDGHDNRIWDFNGSDTFLYPNKYKEDVEMEWSHMRMHISNLEYDPNTTSALTDPAILDKATNPSAPWNLPSAVQFELFVTDGLTGRIIGIIPIDLSHRSTRDRSYIQGKVHEIAKTEISRSRGSFTFRLEGSTRSLREYEKWKYTPVAVFEETQHEAVEASVYDLDGKVRSIVGAADVDCSHLFEAFRSWYSGTKHTPKPFDDEGVDLEEVFPRRTDNEWEHMLKDETGRFVGSIGGAIILKRNYMTACFNATKFTSPYGAQLLLNLHYQEINDDDVHKLARILGNCPRGNRVGARDLFTFLSCVKFIS